MRWFKHLVDSGDDPDVGAIIDKFGPRGYYMFFRTLEIMSREFNIHDPGKNTFQFKWLLRRYNCKIGAILLTNFFRYTSKLGRIKSRFNKDIIHLYCPKLKDLADEYTEKLLRNIGTESGQKSGQNREENKKENKKEKKNKKENKDKESFQKNIIEYFNKITGQKRSLTCDGTNKLINGRLEEGKTVEDFKHVIDTKTFQWLKDPKMRKYLRPSTLFLPGKFEDYLNEPYEKPGKVTLKPGEADSEDKLPIPNDQWTKIAKYLFNEGRSEGQVAHFYGKAIKAFPEIKEQWEKSDKKPETFIRLIKSKPEL